MFRPHFQHPAVNRAFIQNCVVKNARLTTITTNSALRLVNLRFADTRLTNQLFIIYRHKLQPTQISRATDENMLFNHVIRRRKLFTAPSPTSEETPAVGGAYGDLAGTRDVITVWKAARSFMFSNSPGASSYPSNIPEHSTRF